jgi:hypothetical protein
MSPKEVGAKGKSGRQLVIMVSVIMILIVVSMTFTIHVFASTRKPTAVQGLISPGSSSTSSAVNYAQSAPNSFSQFLQSVSSMTIEFNFTSTQGVQSSERISVFSSPTGMDDGTVGFRVNITGIARTGTTTDADSAIVLLDSSGDILQVTMGNEQWTGVDAQKETGVLSFVMADYLLALMNSSDVQQVGSSAIVAVGSTQVSATTYVGLPTLALYDNLEVTLGTIGQNGMQMVLSSHYADSAGSATFRVLSLVLNQ